MNTIKEKIQIISNIFQLPEAVVEKSKAIESLNKGQYGLACLYLAKTDCNLTGNEEEYKLLQRLGKRLKHC